MHVHTVYALPFILMRNYLFNEGYAWFNGFENTIYVYMYSGLIFTSKTLFFAL